MISGCYGVVVYVFELPFGHCVSSRATVVGYSPGHGLIFVVLASTSWLWDGHYAKMYVLWLLVIPFGP
jgi:hypothetical protein